MTLVSKQDFHFNKDETDNRKRYPDLAGSAMSFSITANAETYIVIISWNTWLNSPMVSIYDSSTNAVALNRPIAPRVNDVSPNYLCDKRFAGYYLFWEPASSWFGFYSA